MIEPTEPAVPPERRLSPLRVAIFLVLAAVTVAALIQAARAPKSKAAKRLDSAYYATMGDLMTRFMLGLESQEAQGLALPEAQSADAVAEAAADNYELALERRENDLGLRIGLATVYWHAGRRAEAQMYEARRAGRAANAQELSLRAGKLKTEAMATLQRGLSLRPGDPTIQTVILGLDPRPYTRIRPALVDDAEVRRIAARIAPGHLLMYYLLHDAGMSRRAAIERRKAYRDGWLTVIKLVIAAGFIALGMLAGVATWVITLLRRRVGHAEAGVTRARWSVWRAVEVVVLLMFLQLAIAMLRARLAPGEPTGSLGWIASAAIVYLAAGVGAIAWLMFTAQRERLSLRQLGWRRIGVGRALGVGLAGYAAVIPLVYPVLALLSRFVGGPGPTTPVVSLMMSATGPWSRVLLVGLTVLAAPLVEETVFRGVLYGSLRRRMRPGWAALISGIFFAAVHGQALPLVSYVLLGMVLAYLYERTGSLWAPAVTHGVFNAVSVAAVYLLMA